MGFEHSLSREEKLTRLLGRGELDFEMCAAAIRRLATDLAGERGFGILADVRETDYLPNSADLRRYAALLSAVPSLRTHRLALVVGTTAQFGMGRMFSSFYEMVGGEADVFREIEPAMEWLAGKKST